MPKVEPAIQYLLSFFYNKIYCLRLSLNQANQFHHHHYYYYYIPKFFYIFYYPKPKIKSEPRIYPEPKIELEQNRDRKRCKIQNRTRTKIQNRIKNSCHNQNLEKNQNPEHKIQNSKPQNPQLRKELKLITRNPKPRNQNRESKNQNTKFKTQTHKFRSLHRIQTHRSIEPKSKNYHLEYRIQNIVLAQSAC